MAEPRQPDGTLTARRPAREPSLLESVAAIALLIVLIISTVALFGTDATGGPLQVALFLSALGAGLLSWRLGNSSSAIREAAIGGVASAMSAVYILLAVGALIGTWNLAGTIPTIVYYGIGLLQPSIFYLSAAVICGLVGLSIGSSWTTAATIGVGLVALAPAMGASPEITAGAVISGAYFGDKMTPISETTVLVPSMVGGVSTQQHIGAMIWTSGPAVIIACAIFGLLGLFGVGEGAAFDRAGAQNALAAEFNISLLNLLPMIFLIILSVRRAPPFLAILSSALLAGVMAWFTQPQVVTAFVGEAASFSTNVKALYSAMANGFVSNTGTPAVDDLFSRGGMSSMLTTIWLVLGALSFAAIAESAGFLDRLIRPIVARAKTAGQLIAAVIFTAIGLNLVAGDQYVAIVMPSRVYRVAFRQRGIAPRMLSRTVEDAGTVTSPLVPWNSCGAYMAGVLGVPTAAYLPFCFFNLLSPVISLIYGLTGFRIERIEGSGEAGADPAGDVVARPPDAAEPEGARA
ncbi:MAG TPA: Na+/H+ antiporter NhaC family protein [Candidatus Limnocylindrales bacterium]